MTNEINKKIEDNRDKIKDLEFEIKLRDERISALEKMLIKESKEKDKIYETFTQYVQLQQFLPVEEIAKKNAAKMDKYGTFIIMAVLGAVLTMVITNQ
jgi:septal ring factor EnvC (AmiA/AmiB activator)